MSRERDIDLVVAALTQLLFKEYQVGDSKTVKFFWACISHGWSGLESFAEILGLDEISHRRAVVEMGTGRLYGGASWEKSSGGCAGMGSVGILRLRVRGKTANAPLRMTEFK